MPSTLDSSREYMAGTEMGSEKETGQRISIAVIILKTTFIICLPVAHLSPLT